MRAASFLLVLATLVATAWACKDDPSPPTCKNIPTGGCPSAFGAACDDPTCQAVYTCASNGQWVFDKACPATDGGVDAHVPVPDASALRDVDIDVPGANGGPGCAPLEPPDCTLGLAAACPGNACCGCEDLFVCENGAWSPWGTCADGGALVPTR